MKQASKLQVSWSSPVHWLWLYGKERRDADCDRPQADIQKEAKELLRTF